MLTDNNTTGTLNSAENNVNVKIGQFSFRI